MSSSLVDAALLARMALVATALFALIVVALHVLQREFDPTTRYVSEYALGRYGNLMPLAFFTLAFAGSTLAMALLRAPGASRIAVAGALGVWAAGLIVAGIWRTDASIEMNELTREGTLHNEGARLAFLGVTAAAALLPVHLALTGQTRWLAAVTGASILVVGAFFVLRYSPDWIGPGAAQRLLITAVLLFHAAAALSVLAGHDEQGSISPSCARRAPTSLRSPPRPTDKPSRQGGRTSGGSDHPHEPSGEGTGAPCRNRST